MPTMGRAEKTNSVWPVLHPCDRVDGRFTLPSTLSEGFHESDSKHKVPSHVFEGEYENHCSVR